MGKTSVDARRHVKELCKLFKDVNEISVKIVDELVGTYRQKKYLRQSLKRLIAKGYLKENDGKIRKTKTGSIFFFQNYHPKEIIKEPRRNGKWYLLSFDIPVKFNLKRDALRRVLIKYEFFPLQKSVWIGAHQLSKDVWQFIVENDIEKYCTPMVVDIIEGDKLLREHFRIVKGN